MHEAAGPKGCRRRGWKVLKEQKACDDREGDKRDDQPGNELPITVRCFLVGVGKRVAVRLTCVAVDEFAQTLFTMREVLHR